MGTSIEFIAIKKEFAEKMPQAIKKFVKDFFEEKTIFGIECYVAVGSDYKASWIEYDEEEYKDGLTEDEINDCGVWTWFDNHPEYVFKYYWS